MQAKPKKIRTVNKQTNKQEKQTKKAATTAKNKKIKKRDKELYKVITGSAVVDFFGPIRDSAIIGNMRAFFSAMSQ